MLKLLHGRLIYCKFLWRWSGVFFILAGGGLTTAGGALSAPDQKKSTAPCPEEFAIDVPTAFYSGCMQAYRNYTEGLVVSLGMVVRLYWLGGLM